MKNESLLDIIGMADDKFIEEAAPRKKNNTIWIKIAATAACLCLITGICLVRYMPKPIKTQDPNITIQGNHGLQDNTEPPAPTPSPSPSPDVNGDIVRDPEPDEYPTHPIIPGSELDPWELPQAPIEPEDHVEGLPVITVDIESGGDMGFEGYDLFDISELIDGNPWHEGLEISLPVFRNTHEFNSIHQITNPDIEKMTELMLETAKSLNIDTETLTIEDHTNLKPADHEISLYSETEDYKIRVSADFTVRVDFKNPIPIPEEIAFDYYSSYERTEKRAAYLKEHFIDESIKDSVKANISGGYYNIYLEQYYHLDFHIQTGDIAEDIINYNFNSIYFLPNLTGDTIGGYRIVQRDISDLVAIYPTITTEEALELLKSGNYYTTTPSGKFPGEEAVAKVELVYNTDTYNEYYIPYYKFYVELPYDMEYHNADQGNGIKKFGAYYVPAIDQKWIKCDLIFGYDY